MLCLRTYSKTGRQCQQKKKLIPATNIFCRSPNENNNDSPNITSLLNTKVIIEKPHIKQAQ